MNKIKSGCIVLYNIIRFTLLKVINLNRISCSLIEIISPRAKLLVEKGEIEVGYRCKILEGSIVKSSKEGRLTLGSRVFINRNCNIVAHNNIFIGSGTTIGPNVSIYDHDHDFKTRRGFISAPIKIENNVWIGANVVILKGVTIGENSVIAAGCVITKNVPDNVVVKNVIKQQIIEIKKSEGKS